MAIKIQVFGTLLGSLGLRDQTVTATLCDLNGTPRLGFVADVQNELVAPVSTRTNVDGTWTLSLYGNDDVTSDYGDTIYRVMEGPGFNQYGSAAFYIGVPSSGGPYWIRDLAVTPPGGAAPELFTVVSVDGQTGVVDLSGRYLGLGGGTLTGALTLNADPASALQAATKQYVDNHSGSGTGAYVPLSGGTMSGALVLPGDPSTALQAAPKQYVDNTVAAVSGTYVKLAGSTMTGALTLSGTPTNSLHAATKAYVDNETTRATGAEAGKLSLVGGTLTGALILAADPSTALGAATKQYVDNHSGGVTGSYLPLSGGTLTGSLTLSGAPSSGLHAATKTYVDNETTRATGAEALLAPKASPTFTGTVSGITKSMVGLGNVDNTADTGKPVSTAQQTALDLKANLASPTFTGVLGAAAINTSGNVTVGGGLSVTGVGAEVFVYKTADEAITSNITPQNDDELSALVAANAFYTVELVGVWTVGSPAGGFRCDWTAPTGATMVWTDNDGAGSGALGTDLTFSVTTGTSFKGVLKTSSTAGTLQFRWAQNTSQTGATTLKAGSYLYIRRVA